MRYVRYAVSQCIQFFRDLIGVRSFSGLLELILRLLAQTETHYGCPNSKKTKKLQLKKVLFR